MAGSVGAGAAGCIDLIISRDKMSACVTLAPPDGDFHVSRDDIMARLAAGKVVSGIRESAIGQLAKNPVYNREFLAAQGLMPEAGEDGRLEYMFELSDGAAPAVQPDGHIDYKNMNRIHAVAEGDVLCRIHKPTAGVAGYTVLGAKLPAKPGRPAPSPKGRNTRLSDSGDALIAAASGMLKRNGANLDVLQEFEVKNHVDYSTGNITFVGSVTVRGNVLSGFSVNCGGDATIYGLVEKASITAAGDIVLHGGMTGQGGGSLRAGGNIYAKYIENSAITAGGKITAECIMHSSVRAGAGIELLGRKGLLVGGNSKARDYIKAITIGSPFATQTELELGNDPKVMARVKEIKNEILKLQAEIKKMSQALAMLAKLETAGALTPEKQFIYARTRKISEEARERLESLKREHDAIEEQSGANMNGFVRASGYIYVGVKVSIGNVSLMPKEDLRYCTLRCDGDDIRAAPY